MIPECVALGMSPAPPPLANYTGDCATGPSHSPCRAAEPLTTSALFWARLAQRVPAAARRSSDAGAAAAWARPEGTDKPARVAPLPRVGSVLERRSLRNTEGAEWGEARTAAGPRLLACDPTHSGSPAWAGRNRLQGRPKCWFRIAPHRATDLKSRTRPAAEPTDPAAEGRSGLSRSPLGKEELRGLPCLACSVMRQAAVLGFCEVVSRSIVLLKF